MVFLRFQAWLDSDNIKIDIFSDKCVRLLGDASAIQKHECYSEGLRITLKYFIQEIRSVLSSAEFLPVQHLES